MIQFVNTLLIGLTSGAIYALMALSIVLVWRSTRVINFAQAGQALTSSYFGFEALKYVDSFWLALLIAMVGGALLAAFIEVAFMRVLLKHTDSGPIANVAPIIATLGLLEILHSITTIKWGGADVLIKQPLSNVGERMALRDVVHDDDGRGALVILLGDGAKTLLASSVPQRAVDGFGLAVNVQGES